MRDISSNPSQNRVRFRRSREYDSPISNASSSLFGDRYGTGSVSTYSDFDDDMRDEFAFKKGHPSHGFKRHRKMITRLVLGSVTVGLLFTWFGSSSSKSDDAFKSRSVYQSTGTVVKKKANNKADVEPLVDIEESIHNLPIVQPRRFQKTVVAKPLPMPIQGNPNEKPKDVSGYLIYGQGDPNEKPKDVSGYLIYGKTYHSTSNSNASNSTNNKSPPPPPLLGKTYYNKNKNTNTAETAPPPPLEATSYLKKSTSSSTTSSSSTSSSSSSTPNFPIPPPILTTSTSKSNNSDSGEIAVVFYLYNSTTNTSELPDALYDEHGSLIDYTELEGKELVLEHPPPPLPELLPDPLPVAVTTDSTTNGVVATSASDSSSSSTTGKSSSSTSSKTGSSSTGESSSTSSKTGSSSKSGQTVYVTSDAIKDSTSVTRSNSTHAIFSFPTISANTIHINPAEWENIPQAQDQMIIVSTVATMALLVGALSARRLRSRHFLSSCIENESLEDELMYDTAYTTTGGFGSVGGYDTFTSSGSTGGLPWKGDLEKFDV